MTKTQANRAAKKLIEQHPAGRAAHQEIKAAAAMLDNLQMVKGFIRLLRGFAFMQYKCNGYFDQNIHNTACKIAYQHFLRKPSTKRKKKT